MARRFTRLPRQTLRPFRPCGPSCVGEGWKQRRSVGRTLPHHRRMLKSFVSTVDARKGLVNRNLRFSPVWLYIWVCKDEGRVKRLSHTLHLCFFWVLDGIFELNWLIIDWGPGGALPDKRFEGRGRVRDRCPFSYDSDVVEL